jgi:hypothetical protein
VRTKKPPPFFQIAVFAQCLQIVLIVGIAVTKCMSWDYVIDMVAFSPTHLA